MISLLYFRDLADDSAIDAETLGAERLALM
jgi:hypothetical protein